MSEIPLSNTAYVILGFLSKQPMTGYEIKSHVDKSTRFFWAASYGQIYPELRRLAEAGLVEGTDKSHGKRARIEYDLTDTGRRALHSWLMAPSAGCEMRDEGLLKIFFAHELDRDEAIALLTMVERARLADLAELQTIGASMPPDADDFKYAALDYGIGLYEYVIDWCRRQRAELEADETAGKQSQGRSLTAAR